MRQLRGLLMLLGLLTLITFSGCTRTVYVDRPFEVKVPVPCKISNVSCNVGGSDAEVVIDLAKCIVDLKQEIKVCQ